MLPIIESFPFNIFLSAMGEQYLKGKPQYYWQYFTSLQWGENIKWKVSILLAIFNFSAMGENIKGKTLNNWQYLTSLQRDKI